MMLHANVQGEFKKVAQSSNHLIYNIIFILRNSRNILMKSVSFYLEQKCFQCFDAVGWATGRASGL